MSDNSQNIEQTEDPQFSQGFNNGWVIAQNEPEVSKAVVVTLQQVEKHHDMYLHGLQEGIIHHELEKVKDRYKNYQTPDRGKAYDRDKGKTKE